MSGPVSWADSSGTPFAGDGIWFNQRLIEGGRMVPLSMVRENLPFPQRMMSGTSVSQSFWIGGDTPVNLHPMTTDFKMTISEEADYWAIREAADLGMPVEMWFGWPMTDWWYVVGGDGTRSTWRTSRQQPYNYVTGVTQATYPPAALLDGTPQTIVTSGTPGAGEVKILDSSGYENVTTPTLDPATYTWLQVRYHPLMLVDVTAISEVYEDHNGLNFEISLSEHLGGYYTPAFGSITL